MRVLGAKIGRKAAALLVASATGALAVTQPLDPIALPDDLDALRIEDLTVRDPLGFNCIQEQHIDLAFHASGKGVRMPRTCLPKPCEQALTPFRLAALIGRAPTAPEWDQYFARYADFCRKEVVPFAAADAVAAPADVLPEAAFWLPLLSDLGTGPAPRRGPLGTRPGLGVGGPGGGLGGVTPNPGGPFVLSGNSDDDPATGSPGDGLQPVGVLPVPLPAPFLLLIAALLSIGWVRRRR